MHAPATAQPVPRPYRWSLADYERAVELGAFPPDSHVQLLEGELIEMSPQGPVHAELIDLLADLLRTAWPGAKCRQEKPLHCPPDSEPEPDLVVVPGGPRAWLGRHPRGAEALLVVEIADSSAAIDRRKAGIYARAGVPEYWLVDVPGRRLEVYRGARDGAWPDPTVLREDDWIEAPGTGVRWRVRELLP